MNVADVFDCWSDLLIGRPVFAAGSLVGLQSLVEGLDSETVRVVRGEGVEFPFRSANTSEGFRYVHLRSPAPLVGFTYNHRQILGEWSDVVESSHVCVLSNSRDDIRRWFKGDGLRLLVASGRVSVSTVRPSGNRDFPFECSEGNIWTYCYCDPELSDYLTGCGGRSGAVTVSDIGSQLDASLFRGCSVSGSAAGNVSYRTLSRWLAEGSGELAEEPLGSAAVRTHLDYAVTQQDEPVPDTFRIRWFCSDEWLSPLDCNL